MSNFVEYTCKQQEQVCLPKITHHFPPYHKVTSRSVMLRGVIFIKFFYKGEKHVVSES